MKHPAEKFGRLFVALVRDQAIASFEGGALANEVAKRFEETEGDVGDLVDQVVDQVGDVLVAFLTYEDHSFSHRGGEMVDGAWVDFDWVRSSDNVEFRNDVESYVLGSSRGICRAELVGPGRFGRETWAQAIRDDNAIGAIAYVSYVVDQVAAHALAWIEPSYSRSFTWSENGASHVLETLDDLNHQYFDGGWRETYSECPPSML